MNKQEFLECLERKLNGLSKTELSDILFEYSTHIDQKVLEGSSEQEAISDFGDIDVLISEILNAYESNQNFKTESFKNKTRYYLDRISEFITDVADSVTNINKKDIKNILVKGLILTISLFVLSIPFNMLQNTVYHISRIFPDFISGAIYSIFAGLFGLIYFIFCAYAVYVFVNKEILRNKIRGEAVETEYKETMESVGSEISTNVIRVKKVKTKKNNDINILFANILNVVLKVIVFFIILPLLIALITFIIATGLTVVLAFTGYPLIGVSIVLIGINVSLFSLIIPGMKFIFNWGSKNEKVFN